MNASSGTIQNRIQKCLDHLAIELNDERALSSLDLVTVAVGLEKEFSIQFQLDEISPENFRNLNLIANLISTKKPG